MLVDLDELLLRCRDERARAYISEALACYKAGAYRATIISTWIAVTFDVIDKLRELSLAGDKAAAQIIEEFDAITAAHNIPRAQQFERDLLTVARDKFELISPQEYVDLERLQQDRHRCAHPSQSGPGEVFSPTAELARFHIRNAVEHLLQQEPAQGKAALSSLLATIHSSYFPTDEKKALAILAKSPLKRARPSLVRNLMLVLLKALVRDKNEYPTTRQRKTALMCVRSLHPALWRENVQQSLTALIRPLTTADELFHAAELLHEDATFADAVEEDQVVRLSEFVRRLPKNHILSLTTFLGPGPLRDAALQRVAILSSEEIADIVDFGFIVGVPPEICDRAVEKYAEAKNFEVANEWGKRLAADMSSFSPAHVKKILLAMLINDQIQGSFQLAHVLAAIKKDKSFADPEVAALVAQVEALP